MAFSTDAERIAYEADIARKLQAQAGNTQIYTAVPAAALQAPLTQDQMSDAFATGRRKYEMDNVIGLQIVLGVLAVALGMTSTVPFGLGCLVFTIWLRKF